MKKLIISLHTSLDGFVGGPQGEMDWIKLDDEMFELVGKFTNEADTALYGRVTYEIMESYWPNAADQPDAGKHDKEHSAWYNKVNKVVLSRTLHGTTRPNTTFIGHDIAAQVALLKDKPGTNIVMFGSPAAVHALMEYGLIDELWLFVNPIILGKGIPLFIPLDRPMELKLESSQSFACGVIGSHYSILR